MRILLLALLAAAAPGADKNRPPAETPLDVYVRESNARAAAGAAAAPGSIYRAGGPLAELARDPKAAQVDDAVTILVVERATAVAAGTTKTARQASAEASIGPLLGKAPRSLSQLAAAASDQSLSGEGSTSRSTVLSTTLTARVAAVLPNGYLVIEGSKLVAVNSESQVVTVRGVARPLDIAPNNIIRSDRLAQLEIRINGKGVVGDAVRRPNFLYRLLLGLLPF